MTNTNSYDVIIIGGSYSGLAAAMALGRALKKVLIIDEGKPCNRQTPFSHNFITQDGKPPLEIAAMAREQLKPYDTVTFFSGHATAAKPVENGFEISVITGEVFAARKIIFATGIRDILPEIEGLSACWGISVLHCPYCHGYEVRHEKTAILGNGLFAYDLTRLVSNWTNELTVFTNGPSSFTAEQKEKLKKRNIEVVETAIEKLEHDKGYVKNIVFNDGSEFSIPVLYAPVPFEQHCKLPELLGCQLTEEGYIQVDPFMETSVAGVFACGDNAATMRTVANSVAMGTTAGMIVSKRMILEAF